MAHWSGIGIPKTNAIALEVSYTHTHEIFENIFLLRKDISKLKEMGTSLPLPISFPSETSTRSKESTSSDPLRETFLVDPPRKPRRQVTAELPSNIPCEKAERLLHESSSGDSLHELIRYGRSSKRRSSRSWRS